ncbi:MAG: hypothetical protein KJ832_09730 [Gammaproteobacteria bacterium]|nr:hypothetical protein [Gammaproteobacteria bacterium]
MNGEVLGRYGAAADERFGNLIGATGPAFTPQSDFGSGYAPTGTTSLQTPKSYAVAAGDTLQSIAMAIYTPQERMQGR